MTPQGMAQLKLDEGLRLKAYPDPLTHGAPWTIGYGHTGRDVAPGVVWSQQHAEDVLLLDVKSHELLLDSGIPWWRQLDEARQDVLSNMVFNMGWDNPRTPAHEGLSGFAHTLALIDRCDYKGAAAGMLASAWARQVGPRAVRLAKLMEEGYGKA